MAVGDSQDLRVRALTEELIRRLRDFIAGRETPATLQQWAQKVWGPTQEGPATANRLATEALHDLWNADSRFPAGDLGSPPSFAPSTPPRRCASCSAAPSSARSARSRA
ncbi:hypothetical protein [Nannocystis pusilla]|uniref:hypothetical protein n=1 Tax=Nannocystis pusilla TaxID=889268 RepID=UPI003B79DB20